VRLAKIKNVAGVKEASGNMSQIAEVCASVPENFLVFSGDDAITLPVISLGGVGIISVASNEIPAEMAEMTRLALAGECQAARRIQNKFVALMQRHVRLGTGREKHLVKLLFTTAGESAALNEGLDGGDAVTASTPVTGESGTGRGFGRKPL